VHNENPGIAPEGKANEELTARYQTLHEFAAAARGRLTPDIWHYLAGASETETAMRRNRLAIDSLALRPRILRDVSKIDLSTTFLGAKLGLPLSTAPIGSLESFTPEGGAAAARAAARCGMVSCLSSVSAPGLEATAAAADGPMIYQLYVRGDGAWIDEQVRRAVDAGYLAFCLTVDTALYSRRERDIARRFVKPWRARALGLEFQSALNWDDVRRFKDSHDIPLILKGIMTAEDASLAVAEGVDGIWVSNHGGRQLDHTLGTMAMLPEIVGAVAGRASIIIDGGFLRGTDILKAIALGADLVALGRFTGMALAAGGEEGLVRAVDLLAEEMWTAMGLVGATNLDQLTPRFVQAAPPTAQPDTFSAFPHFTHPV
jgi:isopentenyl diphosphate isomerase/L-lactate dehydrogenase-like FMN-dependent dehydrogenase